MERAPAHPAPSTMPIAASSSSACTIAKLALPSCSTRYRFIRSMRFSTTEDDGVMGYHATTVTPANIAPSAAAALPSMMILPCGGVHRFDHVWVLLGQRARGIVEADAHGVQVQLRRLHLLGKLLANRCLHQLHVDGEQLRRNSHIDHVLDQLAQLCLRARGRGELVERHSIVGQRPCAARSA